jgi:hypothetical protein
MDSVVWALTIFFSEVPEVPLAEISLRARLNSFL